MSTLADGDPLGYPFWVAKVIKVMKESEDITVVEVY